MARGKRDVHFLSVEDFYDILIQVNDLCIEIDAGGLGHKSPEILGLFIGKALHLDADLRSWSMSLGPAWRYIVVDHPHSPLAQAQFPFHDGQYHVYHNINIASMWNHYRQTRIFLNEVITSLSLRLWEIDRAPECQETIFQATSIVNQMADDVCASIPYHFTSGETGFGATIRLLWPLFVASNSTVIRPASKEWILQSLDIIGSTTGIQQAIGMTQIAREGGQLGMFPGT